MLKDTDPAALTADVHRLIPVIAAMGLQVQESVRGRASAMLPAAQNVNHFGVSYAGSLFTVAEMLGGLIGGSSFDVPGGVPLVKRLEIDFLRPATTDVVASTSLSEEEIARVQAAATETGKGDFELIAEVVDANGVVVARTRGDYQLRVMG